MKELYKQALIDVGALVPSIPPIIQSGVDCIPGEIDAKLKALMVYSEFMMFTGSLRKNIDLDGDLIPVSSMALLLAKSGGGKDRAISKIRSVMKDAYDLINKSREDEAKLQAVMACERDGKSSDKWRSYYSKPRDLFGGVGTPEGILNHGKMLENSSYGALYVFENELGSTLANNDNVLEVIKYLAIGYDTGHIPAKTLKSDEHQTDTINNLPCSAIMFGAPQNIILNHKVKDKLKAELATKLARRAVFSLTLDDIPLKTYNSIEEANKAIEDDKLKSVEAIESISPWMTSLVTSTTKEPLTIPKDVMTLFETYTSYNSWVSTEISSRYEMSVLHRKHAGWRAIKLAGCLAILENSNSISLQNYVDSINFIELYIDDLKRFEIELDKEPYELMIDYFLANNEGGFAMLSIHQLKKLGFLPKTGGAGKLKELVELANSADNNKYVISGSHIHFFLEDE